jgi:two-component system response regulator YesN
LHHDLGYAMILENLERKGELMYKVLIVDDEPLVIQGLSRQVDWESLNMELAGMATDGHEILSMLETNPAHILITDVSMPQMDGLTLIAKAKLLQPSLRCIIVSAFNEFDYVKKALQLGVENYLLKPINESELRDTLSLKNLMHDQMSVTFDSPDLLAFRTNILDRWVNGTIQDFELFERAELLHINLSAAEYCVCVIEVIPLDPSLSKIKAASQFLEVCRGFIMQAFKGECFLDNGFRVVAILHGDALHKQQLDLSAVLQKLSVEAETRGIQIFSSVGTLSNSSTDVRASYLSAIFFLNYRYVDPSAAFTFNNDFTNLQYGTPDESKTSLLQFNKYLKEGNINQTLQAADKYLQLYVTNASFQKTLIDILPFILSLVQVMIESGRITDALPASITMQLSLYKALNSRETLKKWLSQTIEETIKVIRDRKGTLHLLVHLTLEQVNKQYATELSLKTLASSFNVSSAYLGQLFREETGKYFNDYLTEVRLQASRTLLLETDLKINEIVQRIGIPNQSYFNRVFKKTYDISPMELRRQSLKQ